MSDFYEAEYSQSYLFYGSISSLPWTLQEYQSDETVVATKIRSTLMPYLEKYFDEVEVECAAEDNGTAVSYDLRIYLKVRQGETYVNFVDLGTVKDGKFNRSRQLRT